MLTITTPELSARHNTTIVEPRPETLGQQQHDEGLSFIFHIEVPIVQLISLTASQCYKVLCLVGSTQLLSMYSMKYG